MIEDGGELDRIAAEIARDQAYEFGGCVGAGAFKRTYRVVDAEGCNKALKLYRADGGQRTEREVEAIRRCSHPHIVRFERIDRWLDGTALVLYSLEEFLDGGTLSTRMAQGPISGADLQGLARKLIESVAHIESLGLVHRDIKPDNIMLRAETGEPVLVDFGLVRDLHNVSLTRTWAPRGPGTPYYSSPEQLNNQKSQIDWRSDQFSLGVVLGEAGFGRHPFLVEGGEAYEAVEAVAERKPVTPEFRAWALREAPQLLRMLAPWPILRCRTPRDLNASWQREDRG